MAILRNPVLTQLIHRKALQLKRFPVNQPKRDATGCLPFRPDGFAPFFSRSVVSAGIVQYRISGALARASKNDAECVVDTPECLVPRQAGEAFGPVRCHRPPSTTTDPRGTLVAWYRNPAAVDYRYDVHDTGDTIEITAFSKRDATRHAKVTCPATYPPTSSTSTHPLRPRSDRPRARWLGAASAALIG